MTLAVIRHPIPPCEGPGSRVLILGSMPGAASLRARQYYAHPRNQFWPIMERLFGIPADAQYNTRLAGLVRAKVALWDVVGECVRPGSLDARIVPDSVAPNDIADLVRRHPTLRAVFLNGATARRLFDRHILRPHPDLMDCLHIETLPSTSPAHASRGFGEKAMAWRALRDWTGPGGELP